MVLRTITPELNLFTIENPVVFTPGDSDLKGKSLFWAEKEYSDRWENTKIFNVLNVLDPTQKIRIDMSDILTPVVHDELQKMTLAEDISPEKQAEQWANYHLPKDAYYNLLIDNIDPKAITDSPDFNVESDTIDSITKRLNAAGVVIDYNRVKEALVSRYIKDSLALGQISAHYGLLGRFASGAGNFIADAIRDPLHLVTMFAAGALGKIAGVGIGGVAGTSIALSSKLGKYAAPLGIAATQLGGFLGEVSAISGNEVAVTAAITNQRRKELGLDPLDLQDVFQQNVLGGVVLGAGLAGSVALFKGGKSIFKRIQSAAPDKPMFNRIFEAVQNMQGRYKNSPKTDTELMGDVQVSSQKADPFEGIEEKKFSPNFDFPRTSDPSVPATNRAFNNSIGSVMEDTNFVKDVEGQPAQKLKTYVEKATSVELYMLSEGLAKAKTYPEFYEKFVFDLKQAGTKNEFFKRLKGQLFEEKTIKQYLETRGLKNITHADAETHRNAVAHAALQNNIEALLEEGAEDITADTFLTEIGEFSPENPYKERAKNSETENRMAFDWERVKSKTEAIIGENKTFNVKTYLMGRIEKLNTYSAVYQGLKAEFENKFADLMDGISVQDLLSQWRESADSTNIKYLLDSLKYRLREIARFYGITYGEIENHVPQKWAQEKVRSVPKETFVEDFFPHLDLNKTNESFKKGTADTLQKEEKKLDSDLKKFDLNTKKRTAKFRERIASAGKFAQREDKTFKRLYLKTQDSFESSLEDVRKQFFDLQLKIDSGLKSEKKLKKISGEQNEKLNTALSNFKRSLDLLDSLKSVVTEFEGGAAKNKGVLSNEEGQKLGMLVDLFRERDISAFAEKDVRKRDLIEEKKLQRSAYNLLQNHKLVPKRRNNAAFLSKEDLIAANNAIAKIPEKTKKTLPLKNREEVPEILKNLKKANANVIEIFEKREKYAHAADFWNAIKTELEASVEANAKKLERFIASVKKEKEKIITAFEVEAKRSEIFAKKVREKAEKNIKNIENRSITKNITEKFKRIEKLKRILEAPLSRDDLGQIYENIITDDLLTPDTHSTAPPALNKKRRILHFLNVENFDKLNQKYGAIPDFRILVTQELKSIMRDIARLKTFGGSAEFFKRELESDLALILGNRQLKFGSEGELKNIVDANIKYVEGSSARPATFLGAFGQIYLSLVRNAALGGAGITTFFDDANAVAFTGSANGFGFFRTMAHYVEGLTKIKITPEEASRMLVVLDDYASIDDMMYRYPTEKSVATLQNISRKIDEFTFMINGVQYLSDRGRIAFNRLFLKELGALATEENSRFVKVLKGYGMTEEDFEKIAKLRLDSDGIPVFGETFKRGRVYEKILRSLYGESRRAISATSQSLKAVLASSGVRGRGMGILNSLFFLKRIPTQVSFDRLILPIMRGEYGEAVKFFAQNLIFTTVRLTLKYLAMGYRPNFEDWNFYREVLIQNASMLPFLQPFLSMDKVDSRNVKTAVARTFLGAAQPLADIGILLADLIKPNSDESEITRKSRISRETLRVIRDFTPIKTHPALAHLYERYLFDNIQLATDPNAYANIAKIEEYRIKSGKIKLF